MLPLVANGRTIPIRGTKGAAVRFTCFKGYRLIGDKMGYCMGTNWSIEGMPVCVSKFTFNDFTLHKRYSITQMMILINWLMNQLMMPRTIFPMMMSKKRPKTIQVTRFL